MTRPAPARSAGGGVFLLQGHRGARGLFPENTLEGFQAAFALGVTAFELDVQLTADDVVVVTHDPMLNPAITRGPDGAWLDGPGPPIRSLRYDELRRYDIGRIRPGSALAAQYPRQQAHDGARTPTLEAVLRALPDAAFNLELKGDPRDPTLCAPAPALANAVLAIVDRVGAAPRVMLESFDWRGPRHVRRARPDIALAWLTRAETVRDARLWWDLQPEDFAGSVPRAVSAETAPAATIWAPEFTDLTEAEVWEAHALGLLVLPWTVNRPADMHRLIRWGVDGLISDRPDIAMEVARKMGVLPARR